MNSRVHSDSEIHSWLSNFHFHTFLKLSSPVSNRAYFSYHSVLYHSHTLTHSPFTFFSLCRLRRDRGPRHPARPNRQGLLWTEPFGRLHVASRLREEFATSTGHAHSRRSSLLLLRNRPSPKALAHLHIEPSHCKPYLSVLFSVLSIRNWGTFIPDSVTFYRLFRVLNPLNHWFWDRLIQLIIATIMRLLFDKII